MGEDSSRFQPGELLASAAGEESRPSTNPWSDLRHETCATRRRSRRSPKRPCSLDVRSLRGQNARAQARAVKSASGVQFAAVNVRSLPDTVAWLPGAGSIAELTRRRMPVADEDRCERRLSGVT